MGVIRKTASIEVLLDQFKRNSGAISTIDLIKRVADKLNKTTVYRVLDRLEDDGIVHSFLGKNGIKWYAQCSDCSYSKHRDTHPHFECVSCGRVDCLDVDVLIPKIPNRQVLTSQVWIQGTCDSCITA